MGQFKDLRVWHAAMNLAEQVYRVTGEFPPEEKFVLSQQLRRAAVSIPSNVAEGRGRRTDRDFKRFVDYAYGSLMELETQLELARRLGFIGESEQLSGAVSETGRMLNALRSELERTTVRRRRTAG